MTDTHRRLRMFAGPNGSGKTTVKSGLQRPREWFGVDINPDEIELTIGQTGWLSLEQFGLNSSTAEIQAFFSDSRLLQIHSLRDGLRGVELIDNSMHFPGLEVNSYHAAVIADFLRRKSLETGRSFTFETVMSSPDKIELLREARSRGYRTYLYYIATEDPAINIQRVKNRVADGGHNVPEGKIVTRYQRSLELLPEAIRETDRAFFFDTSGDRSWYFAEAIDGRTLRLREQLMPLWFEPIWNQFDFQET